MAVPWAYRVLIIVLERNKKIIIVQMLYVLLHGISLMVGGLLLAVGAFPVI